MWKFIVGANTLDEAIKRFFSEKKAERIKKNVKPGMTPEEVLTVEQEASQEFLPDNWLPNAAKRASQLNLASHPAKFSHPDAKISSVIADTRRAIDGFLHTGNAVTELDVFGNAAALDVFKFLSLTLNDGKTILSHLESNSPKIREELEISSISFDELRLGLLSIKKSDDNAVTSGKIKQVYFPVADGYHLLSILTPSGLMFELRNRIQSLRFSEQVKGARDDKRKNLYNEVGFDDLYGLVMIGYGGTQPQNISVLNSTYGGKTYLLPCLPPILKQQNQQLPKKNFFKELLWPKNFKTEFDAVHQLLHTDYNNKNIRDGLKRRIQVVIDRVIELMWSVRFAEKGWSAAEQFTRLPNHQKIWLDEAHQTERYEHDEWLDEIISECTHWFIYAYKIVYANQAILLSDTEFAYIKSLIEENKEDLR